STDGDGIFIKEGNSQLFKKSWGVSREFGLTSYAVKQVLLDGDGRYWCATLRGGITILQKKSSLFNSMLPNKLDRSFAEHFFVSAIAKADEDKFWIGSDGYGLFLWDRRNARLSSIGGSTLSDHSITNILREGNEDV